MLPVHVDVCPVHAVLSGHDFRLEMVVRTVIRLMPVVLSRGNLSISLRGVEYPLEPTFNTVVLIILTVLLVFVVEVLTEGQLMLILLVSLTVAGIVAVWI